MVLKKGSDPTKKPPDGGGSKKQYIQTSKPDFTSNYAAVEAFKDFAASRGLIIPVVEADGKIHRFYVEGDKRGSLNGFYSYFSYPVAAGGVGSWKTGESYTWCAKPSKQLNDSEREALKQQYHQARLQRQTETQQAQAQAAIKARTILAQAVSAEPNHPYLMRKQIPAQTLKVYKGSVLAELRDSEGVLHSLQFIKPDGGKFFLSGGRTKGVFHTLGDLEQSTTIYICEGLATACTVYQWKQSATVAAMNAGNLLPVGLALRQAYPTARLVFAADNDRYNSVGNIGKDKAEQAARMVSGWVLLPEFAHDSQGTDWNDWFIESGGVCP
ncbi:MAG: hypothetical protein E6Q83_05995 [Thiothrix sp.]|nr:MAG: hypothetical protein E6Q83_05995 [Thiothrix sp.]